MAGIKKQSRSRSSFESFALWGFLAVGIYYFTYQMVIRPAQEAVYSLNNALLPFTYKLSMISNLCENFKDPNLSSHQRETLLNEIRNTERGIHQTEFPSFDIAITNVGEYLDPEILKLQTVSSKIREQSLSFILQSTCPSDLFTSEQIEKFQNDIFNRYPHTWLGILLLKLGLYKLENLNPDKYFKDLQTSNKS